MGYSQFAVVSIYQTRSKEGVMVNQTMFIERYPHALFQWDNCILHKAKKFQEWFEGYSKFPVFSILKFLQISIQWCICGMCWTN